MTDPRNVAHDKKVQEEKNHHGEQIAPNAEHAPQPGKRPPLKQERGTDESSSDSEES
jgi:hypothetical protein